MVAYDYDSVSIEELEALNVELMSEKATIRERQNALTADFDKAAAALRSEYAGADEDRRAEIRAELGPMTDEFEAAISGLDAEKAAIREQQRLLTAARDQKAAALPPPESPVPPITLSPVGIASQEAVGPPPEEPD